MRFVILVLVCACGLITSLHVLAHELTAQNLQSALDSQGAKRVARDLWSKPEQWERVLVNISSGQPDWLEVARRLKMGVARHQRGALNFAIARALPLAPGEVLSIVGKEFTVTQVCIVPYIEPARESALAFLGRAEHALGNVREKKLQDTRRACLKRIETLKQRYRSRHGY